MKLILFSPPTNLTNETTLVGHCFEEGLTHFHLRKPSSSEEELAAYLSKIPAIYHKRIILHQHYALAEKFHLKGIHLPESVRRAATKAELAGGKIPVISTSFHHLTHLSANNFPYEYVFLSPIFDSISKPGYKAAFDETVLREALKTRKQQVIALGGIDTAKLEKVRKLGFVGAAVLGAVWRNADVVKAYKKLAASSIGDFI